jgi:hypothetical protein
MCTYIHMTQLTEVCKTNYACLLSYTYVGQYIHMTRLTHKLNRFAQSQGWDILPVALTELPNKSQKHSCNKVECLPAAQFMALRRKRSLLAVLYESMELCTGIFWCTVVYAFMLMVKDEPFLYWIMQGLLQIKKKYA